MEFEALLKLLFGQLGVVGTVCLGAAAALGWLHMQERVDHKDTRKIMYEHFEKMVALQLTVATVLAELKTMLSDERDAHEERERPKARRN